MGHIFKRFDSAGKSKTQKKWKIYKGHMPMFTLESKKGPFLRVYKVIRGKRKARKF